MEPINKTTAREKWKSYKKHPLSLVLFLLVAGAAVVTVGILLFLIAYILMKGIPHLRLSLFAWEYNSENVSMLPAIVNTVLMTALSLLLAVPVGLFSAIYLTEYAGSRNRLVAVVRITAETLSGIPSIVYGLFGYLVFFLACGFGYSLLGGALTLAIMILPLIMRTTEEALKAVPATYREGSYGLGARKLRTIFRIVLPSAMPGILSGVVLGIGRIVGETAALIYTAGTLPEICDSLLDSGATLSVHMYALLSEGFYTDEAYATAVVLLVLVIAINAAAGCLAKKIATR
ncbi:MAG: phosphate ABC transporter permease PtsA [Clostridiales bacterium]|nr:MAG: phosphate ABC transporter permease PtsA [Clostridiales bacterium]PWL53418.1 MAG: phosphate ABC transporter permease PtsA [Clostridiales bacterium]